MNLRKVRVSLGPPAPSRLAWHGNPFRRRSMNLRKVRVSLGPPAPSRLAWHGNPVGRRGTSPRRARPPLDRRRPRRLALHAPPACGRDTNHRRARMPSKHRCSVGPSRMNDTPKPSRARREPPNGGGSIRSPGRSEPPRAEPGVVGKPHHEYQPDGVPGRSRDPGDGGLHPSNIISPRSIRQTGRARTSLVAPFGPPAATPAWIGMATPLAGEARIVDGHMPSHPPHADERSLPNPLKPPLFYTSPRIEATRGPCAKTT